MDVKLRRKEHALGETEQLISCPYISKLSKKSKLIRHVYKYLKTFKVYARFLKTHINHSAVIK